ncbi:hypothetical protein [Methylohalobius crimeensis]|uniref:hypothetical protein n=1 Tax=Methylohalobius crimeensis TaxID=244365 RepID=UPI0003B50FFC|nr:hypothetical protein [Methylohalobius crimeensis]
MNKTISIAGLATVFVLLFATPVLAFGDHGHGRGYGKHRPAKHVIHHRPQVRHRTVVVHNYYNDYRPRRHDYRHRPRDRRRTRVAYRRYDDRGSRRNNYRRNGGQSTLPVLIGGAVGGVLGYELSRGNAVTTGVGATAGAVIGQVIGR